jgi:Zn-dependent protease
MDAPDWMSISSVFLWLAAGFLLLRGIQYVLGARIYLTSAVREPSVAPLPQQEISPGELELLTSLDAELQSAGFRHVGFGQCPAFLTYYGPPEVLSAFVHDGIPAYASVRRQIAPEYDQLVGISIETVLPSGEVLTTTNTQLDKLYASRKLAVEALVNASIDDLTRRHAERVAAAAPSCSVQEQTLDDALKLHAADMRNTRDWFRSQGWTVATRDPTRDQFSLRGAFVLAGLSMRVFAKRRVVVKTKVEAASADRRRLRVEADLVAVLRIANPPEPLPETPWPLITLIAGTAVVSFIAMSAVWNWLTAALILAVLIVHEAGHAIAMRLSGYRDVHVFFVPLLGALTIGRPAAASVRDRLGILLAGPVPGLCLAVLLLLIDARGTDDAGYELRIPAFALLILNGLNLLPFTPLDGGRILETLSRPESPWRLAIHTVSAVALIAAAFAIHDPTTAIIGFLWACLVPRQLVALRLRRAVAARGLPRSDFAAIVRAALETMAGKDFPSWRAAIRQTTARAVAQQFGEAVATPADRVWGGLAYLTAWVPAVVAAMLWAAG